MHALPSIGPGAKNKVGPEFNGLDGRHSGSAPGYSYSAANKKSGIVWDKAKFEKYINDPRAMVPGTKMIFPGIKNPKEIDEPLGLCQPVRRRREEEVARFGATVPARSRHRNAPPGL